MSYGGLVSYERGTTVSGEEAHTSYCRALGPVQDLCGVKFDLIASQGMLLEDLDFITEKTMQHNPTKRTSQVAHAVLDWFRVYDSGLRLRARGLGSEFGIEVWSVSSGVVG